MEKLKEMIENIIEERRDDERAHSLEDTMRAYALELIAKKHPASAEIAKLALSTSKLKFSRWCA